MWSMLLVLKKRNRPQNYLLLVVAIGSIYYANYAIAVSPMTDYSQMAYLTAVNEFIVPSWMVCHLLYLESHLKGSILNSVVCFILFVPSIVHAGIMAVVYYMMDFDKIAAFLKAVDEMTANGRDVLREMPSGFEDGMYRMYYVTSELQYHYICLALCLCTFVMACFVMYRQGFKPFGIIRFLFSKGITTPGILTSILLTMVILLQCPLMYFGRSYIITSPYLGLTLTLVESLCIFVMCFVEYMSHSQYVTLKGLSSIRYVQDASVVGTPADGAIFDSLMASNIEISHDEAREISILYDRISTLVTRLQYAFEVDKVYRNPNLTLQMLAEKLNTNRTSLSMALKCRYNMTFKEYLSNWRIEKAKEYMLSHPDEVMESVAEICGFGGSSNFSHKFKDEVGESPKAWLQAKLKEDR